MKYPKFSVLAQQDLYEIAAYVSADNPSAAARVINAIEETAVRIAANSRIGRIVDSATLCDGLRFLPCARFTNFHIYYRTVDEDVVIVRILHGARDASLLI